MTMCNGEVGQRAHHHQHQLTKKIEQLAIYVNGNQHLFRITANRQHVASAISVMIKQLEWSNGLSDRDGKLVRRGCECHTYVVQVVIMETTVS